MHKFAPTYFGVQNAASMIYIILWYLPIEIVLVHFIALAYSIAFTLYTIISKRLCPTKYDKYVFIVVEVVNFTNICVILSSILSIYFSDDDSTAFETSGIILIMIVLIIFMVIHI